MSKLPLDLSKFRKIKSDKHSSTFQHYAGHELTIAHNKLSSKLKSQLDNIPTSKPKMDKVKKFAEAGMVTSDDSVNSSSQPSDNFDPNSLPVQYNTVDRGLDSDSTSKQLLSDYKDRSPQQSAGLMDSLKGAANFMMHGPSTDQPTSDSTAQPNSASQSDTSTSGPDDPGPDTTNPPANPDPYGINAANQQMLGGVKQAGAGEQAFEMAKGQAGVNSIPVEQGYQNQAQAALAAYQKANEPVMKERQALITDINGRHIDPKKYVNEMSTGKKISTGIGLVLGGMGAGLTHGPDLAFQYLQDQIARDIDSQKAELGKKNTLLNHNFQQSKSLEDAYNMTRIQTQDMLASHLRTVADQTADPMAKARVMQIAGMTDQKTAELQHGMAIQKMQQAAFSGAPGSGSMLEMLPQDMRERAVQMPDGSMRLGITKDGAKEVRDQVQSIQPIFDSLNKLQALGASALVPGTPANQQAEAIRAQMIPLVNENAGLKRLSAEDIANIKLMFNDPTKFSSLIGGGAKTNTFKSFLQDKLMSTMGSQLEGGYKPRTSSGGVAFKPRK